MNIKEMVAWCEKQRVAAADRGDTRSELDYYRMRKYWETRL